MLVPNNGVPAPQAGDAIDAPLPVLQITAMLFRLIPRDERREEFLFRITPVASFGPEIVPTQDHHTELVFREQGIMLLVQQIARVLDPNQMQQARAIFSDIALPPERKIELP